VGHHSLASCYCDQSLANKDLESVAVIGKIISLCGSVALTGHLLNCSSNNNRKPHQREDECPDYATEPLGALEEYAKARKSYSWTKTVS
jgi:hypothetical protein